MKVRRSVGIVLSLLCLLGFLQLCPFSLSFQHSDFSKGKQVMNQLAKQSVADIDAQILQIQNKLTVEESDVESFAARFSGTIIMGDSLAAGMLDYGIMPSSIVLAERGNRTNNIDSDVQSVINYAPKIVFMEYGINDLGYVRGNSEMFIEQYKEQVQKIKKALPNTKIYINGLTPISKAAQNDNVMYTYVDKFNTALQTMCKELKITYIDNSNTIDFSQDVYEYDGVHPYYEYYPLWLNKMANVAGL